MIYNISPSEGKYSSSYIQIQAMDCMNLIKNQGGAITHHKKY